MLFKTRIVYLALIGLVFFGALGFFLYIVADSAAAVELSVDGQSENRLPSLGKALQLEGRWHVVWDRLLPYDQVYRQRPGTALEMPTRWGETRGERYPVSQGAATFWTEFSLPDDGLKGILVPEQASAYRFWINGTEVGRRGMPGLKAAEEVPAAEEALYFYRLEGERVFLVVHISSFNYYRGGNGFYPWEIGDAETMVRRQGLLRALSLLVFAFFVFLALINLIYFFFQRSYSSSLHFGIFCFLMAAVTLVVGRGLMVPGDPAHPFWVFLKTRGELLLFVLGAGTMLVYLSRFYPRTIFSRFVIPLHAFLALVFAGLAFTPSGFFRYAVLAFAVYTVLLFLFLFAVLLEALLRRRPFAGWLFAAYLVLFLTVLNDLAVAMDLFYSQRFLLGGALLFALFQGIFLFRQAMHRFAAVAADQARLRRGLKQWDHFLGQVTSELHVPVHGINELGQSLLVGSLGPLTSEQMSSTALIIAHGVQLSNQLSAVLDFTRIQDNSLELNSGEVNLFRLITRTTSSIEALLMPKGIHVENKVPREAAVVGDEKRLEQVVYTIIQQASQKMEQGAITVESRGQGESVQLSFFFSETCFTPEMMENSRQLWGAFDLDSEDDAEGCGAENPDYSQLSLAIAFNLLELHGGFWEAEAQQAGGLRVSLSLPAFSGATVTEMSEEELLQWEALRDLEPVLEQINEERPVEILLADSNLTDLSVLKSQLAAMNYAVIPMMTGESVLERLDTYIPDLLLINVKLADMSGYGLCQKVRQLYSQDKLPILLIIDEAGTSDMMEGLVVGANDFLVKPFSQEEFLTRINTHLQLSRINSMYSRFVPTEFLRSLGQDNITDLKLGDQVQREMTILFVDIRSFTTLSENMTPQENFKFINSYLSRFSPMINRHNGFVDKYIGDAIMALYPGKPEDAIQTAVEMTEHVKTYNIHRAKCGYKAIDIGIGIHTGNLILGIIGDGRRMQGTVISDAVNLAARIQDVTKLYKTNIVVSQETFTRLEDPTAYRYRYLGRVRVKGKDKTASLFEFFDADFEDRVALKEETKQDFETAILLFSKKQMKEAAGLFRKVLEKNPEDSTAELFLNRIERFEMEEKRAFLTSL